jgi:hypothetical protein
MLCMLHSTCYNRGMRKQEDQNDITIEQETVISTLFTAAWDARGFDWDFQHGEGHHELYNEEVIMILNQLELIWDEQTQDEIAVTLGHYLGCEV